MSRQSGFTLIELVLVILMLAIAAVPLFGLFTQASASLLSNERLQTAVQLAQERAEAILALRRSQDFAAIGTGSTTDALGATYSGYSRTVMVSQPPTGPGCPGGASCKEVVVTVADASTTLAEISFLLVDY